MIARMEMLLGAYLLLWVPFGFANELLVTLPTAATRDAVTTVELVVHGLATALSAGAGWMVLVRNPAAMSAATAAVVVGLAVGVQSVLWTVLPRQIGPGQHVPLVLFACLNAAFWLTVIRRIARRRSGV